jgi:hypothetical protein
MSAIRTLPLIVALLGAPAFAQEPGTSELLPDPATPQADAAAPAEPSWVTEQRRLDSAHQTALSKKQRDLDLKRMEADIAEQEARRLAALAVGREASMPQVQVVTTPAEQPKVEAPPPPPPPPSPPTLLRVVDETAVLSYDGREYRLRPGESLPDGYLVESVSFTEVVVKAPSGALRLSTTW